MANQLMHSVKSGAISGAIWDGQYGYSPSVQKAKRTKEGEFVKDEKGKQVYTPYYNAGDLLHIAFVANNLYAWLLANPKPKDDEQTDQPKF